MKSDFLRKVIGAVVFLISLIVLLLTVQCSVSFWDPGEISAASYSLMVPHPPGGPFWLLVGRIFSMIPFAKNIGFRINLVSVLSGALTVLLLYLIAIRLIEYYKGGKYLDTTDRVTTYLSAAVGALALSFCGTFWFNATESNYFALSTLMFASIVWLMMIWLEKSETPGNEKYIVLMAYIIGVSAGVHLMSVLAILTFVGVVIMKKYVTDEEFYKKSAYIFLLHLGILTLVALAFWNSQTDTQAPSPEQYFAFDSKFEWIMIGISAVYVVVLRKKIFSRNSFYFPIAVGGIVLAIAYPGIVKLFPTLLLTVGGPEITTDVIVFLVVLATLLYLIYWTKKNNKSILNVGALCMLFALIGFTSYTMIIIRSSEKTPMNENSPDNFKDLVYYLNREQYGDFPIFKRRFSDEPAQQGIYTNYSTDLQFLWEYQINHMFTRYLLWNFVGRKSTVQDSGVNWGEFWAIPFLIGLLGIYFHFKKDWKMASWLLILFLFMGYLTAFYQNQQQPQPRERHYFYAGAYFVFALWIAIGTKELITLIINAVKSYKFKNIAAYGTIALLIVLIPIHMLRANYYTHDRSKNWLPWDLSYNLLQSCKHDAILFTGGDNDTFPLWYLQYVEGIRRDVRVVCLSLANTSWYLKQLKDTEPYGAPKVKFNMTDAQLDHIEPIQWNSHIMNIPVSKEAIKEYGVTDSTAIKSGEISFKMPSTLQSGDISAIRVQDLAVLDIIESNTWDRPIYFALTCSSDSFIGLDDYLKLEGMTYRLVPQKGPQRGDYLDASLLKKELLTPEDSTTISKEYSPEFLFRGLNNKNIFFSDMEDGYIQNYRNIFIRLASYYQEEQKNNALAIKTLDVMENKIPRQNIKIDYRLLYNVANIYYNAGDLDRFKELALDIEPIATANLKNSVNEISSPFNSFSILTDIYIKLKEYNKALDILNQLKTYYPNDPGLQNEIERLKQLAK
jgi:Protein O-mannosyl-transferase TMEM260-like